MKKSVQKYKLKYFGTFNMSSVAVIILSLVLILSCENMKIEKSNITASDILGNPEYLAISYGGYRGKSRAIQPTISELKEDLKILYAMGIRVLRTYNVHLEEASNLLKSISELKKEDKGFEMYIMLGAWIDCKNAWTHLPLDHNAESENNAIEINRAVELANQYPDIVKIIAVGNEAMVKWATKYYVQPWVILNWVKHLQDLKQTGKLSKDVWITSSDNFASWGGGESEYHTKDLNDLYEAVDYVSIHTYPMHDTHYNPEFWGIHPSEQDLTNAQKIEKAMMRSRDYAIRQYESVVNYMRSIGVDKPVHIGETGWATRSNGLYGDNGSLATDEYKAALYYQMIRSWSNENNISCFYFEAFDEQWKDSGNPGGSENHFGLINLKSEAKYALWDLVDKGVFDGLSRDGKPIRKTYGGDRKKLMEDVKVPHSIDHVKMFY